ncbi:hypothetical protein ABTK91_20090, partial [Acinetobacter baumannii]
SRLCAERCLGRRHHRRSADGVRAGAGAGCTAGRPLATQAAAAGSTCIADRGAAGCKHRANALAAVAGHAKRWPAGNGDDAGVDRL